MLNINKSFGNAKSNIPKQIHFININSSFYMKNLNKRKIREIVREIKKREQANKNNS